MFATSRHIAILVTVLLVASVSLVSIKAAESEQILYPRHADLATLGTVLGMRGQTASERGLPVRFATPEMASWLVDPEFRYEEFYLHQILINKVSTITGEPDTWRVQGVLVFEDVAARRALAQYSTYYRVQENGIVITRTAAKTLTPPNPAIVWFALRKEDVEAEMLQPKSHAELIRLAATQSLATAPSETDEYVIYVLSMDRFAASEQMVLQSDIQDLETESINLGGWPVGIFTGHIDPDEINGKLSVSFLGDVFSKDTNVLPDFPVRPFEWDQNTD